MSNQQKSKQKAPWPELFVKIVEARLTLDEAESRVSADLDAAKSDLAKAQEEFDAAKKRLSDARTKLDNLELSLSPAQKAFEQVRAVALEKGVQPDDIQEFLSGILKVVRGKAKPEEKSASPAGAMSVLGVVPNLGREALERLSMGG